MRRRILAAGLAALAYLGGGAAAAEPVGWSGVYAGLGVDVIDGASRWDASNLGVPLATDRFDVDGMGRSAILGINWRSGRVVFGFEADYSAGGANGVFNGVPCAGAASGCFVDIRRQATLRARVGVTAARGLYYVTLGRARAEIDVDLRGIGADSAHRTGTVSGLGAEWALDAGWRARAEMLSADYGAAVQDFGPLPLNVRVGRHRMLRLAIVHAF
jgi:hypothetical protein